MPINFSLPLHSLLRQRRLFFDYFFKEWMGNFKFNLAWCKVTNVSGSEKNSTTRNSNLDRMYKAELELKQRSRVPINVSLLVHSLGSGV